VIGSGEGFIVWLLSVSLFEFPRKFEGLSGSSPFKVGAGKNLGKGTK